MRIVIDTNVFVSGLLFGGIARRVLDLIEDRLLTHCFTPTTFQELERVLSHEKFTHH